MYVYIYTHRDWMSSVHEQSKRDGGETSQASSNVASLEVMTDTCDVCTVSNAGLLVSATDWAFDFPPTWN